MTDVFSAIAEPSRRRILSELSARDGMLVGEIVDVTRLSQPNVSKHLRVLREGGLVYEVPEGKARRYRVDPSGLAPLDEWLASYRDKWISAVDALGDHLDRKSREKLWPPK